MKKKGEPQYQDSIRAYKQRGYERLGLMSSWAWNEDPKRLVFTLSRYKFVAKMLDGCRDVLEVGCADAFGSRIVAQATGRLTALDFDPDFVQAARDIQPEEWRFDVIEHDIMEKPVDGRFDGIYSLDVYEHIPADRLDTYIRNMCRSLAEHGVLIIGTPSLESQAHASEQSRIGHVNCRSQPEFKESLLAYFHNVFNFSMNDEVVHTGYHKMSNYNFALCCGYKA